ncbi:MAG: DUF423 domain-containing protein [Gammaproteobacteria bacterium]|jgi:uncharacterized membrane protein YgdD (TMEM256/DUF423 family)|nr:DUF423 domain-containing protein [Gammaproteobacteria bacterium]
MSRLAILLGAGNAVLAILLGAFAAHAVRDSLSAKMLSVFHTAVDYHLYHALGLIIVGLLINQRPNNRLLNASVVTMLMGIIIFCGSLYALSLTGLTWLGMITPFGGIALVVAWALVLFAFIKQ